MDQIQPTQVNQTPQLDQEMETVAQKLSRQEKVHYGLEEGNQNFESALNTKNHSASEHQDFTTDRGKGKNKGKGKF